MSDLINRTAKLIPKNKRIKPFPGYATAYHYESEDTNAAKLGSLYVIIEVLTASKPAEAVADLVIETSGNSYYNSPDSNLSVLEHFENAIKTTNAALADYTNAGNASWVGRMSAVIAVLAGEELHLTQTGSAEAYLYRGNLTSHITSDLQNKSQPRPIHTFANIVTGELQLHDRLIIATPAFFHQLQRQQIKAILNDNTANAAIQKLSELVNQSDDANRIAAAVVEVSTSELLALQMRHDHPDEVAIGQADKPIDIAKAVTAPIARSLANTSKTVSNKAIQEAKTNFIPKARQHGFTIATAIRNRLRTSPGRAQLALGLIIIILGFSVWGLVGNRHNTANTKVSNYNEIYKRYVAANNLLAQGNKASALKDLLAVSLQLDGLSKSVNQVTFEKELNSHPHPQQDPASLTKLQSAISLLISQIDGNITLTPTVLSNFSQFKNAQPTKIEVIGNKIFIFDSQNNNTIYAYEIISKTLNLASKGTSPIGHIIATTISSDGSGIYLLTDKPGVWYLKAFDSSLTEQTLSFGNWPQGKSIASYNGSLYMISADSSQLLKFTPTAAGFTVPSNYFKDATVVNGATSITIDGSIYLAGGPSGLRRFTAGKLDQTLMILPSELKNPSVIYSINNTDRLIMLDATSQHIGLFTNNPGSIAFQKQLLIKGAKNVAAITTDTKSTILFALADGKLVSAPLPQ